MILRNLMRTAAAAALATAALSGCDADTPVIPSPPPVHDAGPTPDETPSVSARLESLSIDGKPSPARVHSAAETHLDLTVDLAVAHCSGCPVQIAVSVGDETACVFDDVATGMVSASADLIAPGRIGHHEIRMAAALDADCDLAEAMARRGEVIGELVVEARPEPTPENRPPAIGVLDQADADFATDCETRGVVSASDPDGDALRFEWELLEGDARIEANGAEVSVSGGPARRVEVQARVIDEHGAEAVRAYRLDLPECEMPAGAVASADGQSAYLFLPDGDDFDAQRYAAAMMGGHLATVNSPEEMALMTAVAGGNGSPWVGHWSPDGDGHFEYITGEPVRAETFCRGEPNNAGGQEFAAELWDIGCLNDEYPGRARPGMVEFELPGGPDDVSAGGAFDRPGFGQGETSRTTLRIERTTDVRIRVTDGADGCDGVGDPTLRVLFAGDELAANDDFDGLCSRIEMTLEPGIYHLNVRGYGDQALEDHVLSIELDADLTPEPAPEPEFSLVDGDGRCPGGHSVLSPEMARDYQRALCNILPSWHIVRLSGGGSMDGPGYGCAIRNDDDRDLGQTFCVIFR